MRDRLHLSRVVLAGLFVAALATSVAAQQSRLNGVFKDESGQPIKDVKVECRNPGATPSSFTVTSDKAGRWVKVGLQSGWYQCVWAAPGFISDTARWSIGGAASKFADIVVTMIKGVSSSDPLLTSGLTPSAAKELQADLKAADELFNLKDWDGAIEKYKGILVKVPALSIIHLQIAQCQRMKKDYDGAIASYNELLKTDPVNERAKIGIGITHLEKGDLKAADETLTEAAGLAAATREVFYNLGEVKFAKGEADEAAKWYQRAIDADPSWGKPLFKLGLVALNKGDKDGAIKMFEKVLVADPMSPEAGQAKAVIEQLKK